jgi:hypothetical protein
VFAPFNIDAKVNAAYVVIGLLYGKGVFTNTMEITTRCGQDADCNPSSAGGILGTLLGYDGIPVYWKQGLKEAEEINFKYTTMSLNSVYEIGLKHALQNVGRNGGNVNGDKIMISIQQPKAVQFEKSFSNLYVKEKKKVNWAAAKDEISFDYEGTGFVLRGESGHWGNHDTVITNAELYIDGKRTETINLPVNFTTRRHELCWNYDLPQGKHNIRFKILNPSPGYSIPGAEAIIYSNTQPKNTYIGVSKPSGKL